MLMVHTEVDENYHKCLKSKYQTVQKYNKKSPCKPTFAASKMGSFLLCLMRIIFYSQANFTLQTEFSAVIVIFYYTCDNNNNRIS
jgi:hypothetical protein